MKKISKILAFMLVLVLTAGMCAVGMTAYAATDDVLGNYKFDITSTYKNVDWDNWKAYKAETHVHTVRSDASTEVDDMIEYYYGFGYDAMALTDHGTVNYGWTSGQSRIAIFDYQFFVYGALDEPSKSRYTEITTGTGAVSGGSTPRGYGMREIPLGIELNGMSAKKCHINGFYADYGHGDLGLAVTWPRDAVAGNYKAGGLTHINHVGEWSDAKDDVGVYDSSFISDFASIYKDYGIMRKNRDESNLRGCLGMELVNTADSRTHNDRYLYDEILKILAPQGINVLAFCEDDAHELSDCDRNAQYFIMPSNDMETNNIKHSMMYGEFYACSKNSKNSYELGSGFSAVGAYPSVSYVGVDAAKNQIIIDSKNANKIRIVADGEIIDTLDIKESGSTTAFDLNKYENKINSYVRIYLTGPGGILYLQPFLVEKTVAPVSMVEFIKPSTDTDVKVYNKDGQLVNAVNSQDQYVLDAGNYTYVASRAGYITTDPIPFTVSQADIDNGVRNTITVNLEKDSTIVYTSFYVPETIYVSGNDGMTFESYVDRGNSEDSAINSNIRSTGNVYFHRDGASNISISYETVEGTMLNSLTIGKTSDKSSSLETQITAGKMSSAIASGGYSLIKWTASYTCGGKQMKSYAYTYIYGPLRGGNSTVAAGGYAETNKNILSWAHTTMHITATVWMTGVHSVSGGSGAYKFTPNGGSALADVTEADSLVMSGVGMGTASDKSNGGSKTINVVGGTGTITIDTSRYNNLNQIPGLKVGLDINNCTEGENASETRVSLGDNPIYYSTTPITNAYSGRRIFESDNTSATNSLFWPIDTSVSSLTVNGYASCKKSDRTDAMNGAFTLALKYVDKGELRDLYNNAVKYAYQPDWFENAADYDSYVNSIKNAAVVLGNPAANQTDITNAANGIKQMLSSVKLKKGTFTINHIDETTGSVLKTETVEYTLCDTIIASAEEFGGYGYANSWKITSGSATVASGNTAYGNLMALNDNYTITFCYAPVEYNVQYSVSDPSFAEVSGKAQYGKAYTVISSVPVQNGYTFAGWYFEEDGNVYKPGDSFIWNYACDSVLTAKWDANSYTASYSLDGGTGITAETETVHYMDSYTLITDIPEKAGFIFAGWTAETQSGEILGTYTAGSTLTWDNTENITFTAQWKSASIEVTFDTDGGTISADKINVGFGAAYGNLPVPEKTGYIFEGWYLENSFINEVTKSTIVNTYENHTLYAFWSTAAAYIEPEEKSTTVVDNVLNLIRGIKERITKFELENGFIDVVGENTSLEYETGIGLGTGSKVKLYERGALVSSYQLVVYGDVDGDGSADGQDVQLAQLIKDGVLTKADVGEAVWEAADCDHDGEITDSDVKIIIDSGIKFTVIDQTK